jgi:hypothetical protein
MSESIKIKSIRLDRHFQENTIDVSHLERPHGKYSDPVVNLDIMIDGEGEQKLQIPYGNVDEVIDALKEAKDICQSMGHNNVHTDLYANTGGGE